MAEQPSDETIARIKAENPGRVLSMVDSTDKIGESETIVFTSIMVGPTRDEYDIYTKRMLKAAETKDGADKVQQTRLAIESSVLGLIKWPDREVVKREFEARPQIIDAFADTIDHLSGGHVENRLKNL